METAQEVGRDFVLVGKEVRDLNQKVCIDDTWYNSFLQVIFNKTVHLKLHAVVTPVVK